MKRLFNYFLLVTRDMYAFLLGLSDPSGWQILTSCMAAFSPDRSK
jgi:hypothetical protein